LVAGTEELLNGRFALGRTLGEGAMGVVYEARDRQLGDDVALKLLKPIGGQRLVQFKHEFRALQGIHHPNLVGLRELLEDRGRYFFTMELVRGETFLDHVGGDGDTSSARTQRFAPAPRAQGQSAPAPVRSPPPSRQALKRLRTLLVQLADGLAALHRAGKVHRDVKPANVLVDADGRLVIVDFGLVADDEAEAAVGVAVGTPNYMAPEQAYGAKVGPAADWYAVGAMLFRALTGRLPFLGDMQDVMWHKANRQPPRADDFCSGLPRDLVELCDALLVRDPERRAGAQAIRAAAAEVVTSAGVSAPSAADAIPAFVGRAAELALLQDARERGGVTVLIEGESGIGKSTLLREFVARVRAATPSAVVLSGRCFERESVPFKGVDGVIDALAQHLARLDEDRRRSLLPEDDAEDVGRLFPAVAERVSRRPSALAAADAQRSRERAFRALRRVLGRLAERGLVITIDDLQWTDGDSIALLQLLLAPPAPPLLLLATLRRDSPGAALAAALPGDVRRVPLASLAPDDARALAQHAAAGRGLREEDSARIATQARGHPLFIDALARHAATQSEPPRLEDALWARALGCTPRARGVLSLASLAGGPIPLAVVAEALALSLGELDAEVAQLRAAQLVVASGTHAAASLQPYHDRVRAAALAHLDAPASVALHGSLAGALARHHADPEAIGYHLLAAGEPERAREHYARAAEQASRTLAFDRAVRLYRQTLALGGDALERAAWLDALGGALNNAGRGEEAAAAYLEAVPAVEPATALALRKRAAETLLVSGRADEGTRVLDGVLRQLGAAPRRTRLGTLLSLGLRRLWLKIRGLGFTKRDPAQIDPAALFRADVLWIGALGLAMVDTVRGAEMQSRYLLEALRLGDGFRVMRALTSESLYVASSGNLAGAERVLEAVRAVAHSLGRPNVTHAITVAGGVAAFIACRWQRAFEALSPFPGFVSSDMTSETWWLHDQVDIMTCGCRFFLGRFADYRQSARRTIDDAARSGRSYLVDNIESGIGVSLPLADDDLAATEAQIARQARRCPAGTTIMHMILLYAETYRDLYLGEGERAHARIVARTPAMRRALLTQVYYFRIMLSELRGRAALLSAAAAPASRRQRWREADSLAGRLAAEGTPTATAFAANLRAHLATQRDPAQAPGALEAARAAFDEAHMSLHAAAVGRRLGEAAGDPALCRAAEAQARDEGVVDPARFFRMLA
jgi:eukaryotic-like serine/threonine-protein kinase